MADTSARPVAIGVDAGENPRRRLHDLDALRGFAMLLGIGLHASLAFFPAPWWVQGRTSSLDGLFDEFLWAVHGFRMPVFFLMSGFFTALLWRRRSLGALLNHRLRRVALPLLIGMFTIVPLTSLVGDWAAGSAPAAPVADDDIWGKVFAGDVAGVEQLLDGGFDPDLRSEPGGWALLHAAALTGDVEMLELLLSRGAEPAAVATASEGETPLGVAFHFGHEAAADLLVVYRGGDPLPERMEWSEVPGWGAGAVETEEDDGSSGRLDLSTIQRFFHLWFLWFLLWLVAGFAIVAWAVDRRVPHGSGQATWPRWVMWSMIPLTIVPQLYMGGGGVYPVFGPDTSDGLIPLPHVLAYYATFFAFGALMYRRRGRSGELLVDTVGRPWWAFLPVSFLVVLPAGLVFTFDEAAFSWPAASVLQVAYAWGMCFGLMGLFRVLLAEERPGVRFLSDSSYWLYLAHLPLVVVAQAVVRDWNLPAEVKFLMISVAVTVLLLLTYRFFIRYTPIGTMLNGRKLRPTS
ncbi:MAG: acyltransferase family protein [bacterium]|nr:acyltransferase family protein [bacterium]